MYNYSDGSSSSSSSSSIGKNSDLSANSMEKSGEEVQSSYNEGALDAMEALEEVLPMRRGISSFYNGKSKSYTNLSSSSSSSSIKDIAKPDNPYVRKRRNLLSCTLRSCRKSNAGRISKKSTRNTTLALGLAMAGSESDRKEEDGECNSSDDSSSFPTWRSFSFADLKPRVSVSKTRGKIELGS